MTLLISLAALLSFSSSPMLLKNISKFSQKIHNSCLQSLPSSSQHPEAHAALLCGENVTVAETKEVLVRSSLIHLFVVSGSHLLLLEDIFELLRIPWALGFFAELFYAFSCAWQAPIVRAFLGQLCRKFLRPAKSGWPTDMVLLATGLFTLCLFPSWVSSRSLQMSWLAALAFACRPPRRNTSWLSQLLWPCVLVHLFMLPALWGFGNLHPLSILLNIFLAPLVSFYLLPLSFLNCFIPSLSLFFDRSFEFFLWLCRQFSEPVQIAATAPLSARTLWLLILSLHFFIFLIRLQRARKRL
jgi:competence protein ComEC